MTTSTNTVTPFTDASFTHGTSKHASTLTPQKIGIIGCTGAVGEALLQVLIKRSYPMTSCVLFASAASAGKQVSTPCGTVTIQTYALHAARNVDVLFLAVSGSFALQHVPALIQMPGAPLVIDNSSAYRLDPTVPLVVPEVNGATALLHHQLIANPNCTSAIASLALWPLHCTYGLSRVIVSTYQAASGSGAPGMAELLAHTSAVLGDSTAPPLKAKVFSHSLAFNVLPHIDVFTSNGYTKEEMKVVLELRKVFQEPSLRISCTAVRVPTLRAHCEAISIETLLPLEVDQARQLLRSSPGLELVDDPSACVYPMPLTASEKDEVEVGRLRPSLVFDRHGLDFFVAGDQLLRGAALNAVLIAEYVNRASSGQGMPPPRIMRKACRVVRYQVLRSQLFRLVAMSTVVTMCGVVVAAWRRRGK